MLQADESAKRDGHTKCNDNYPIRMETIGRKDTKSLFQNEGIHPLILPYIGGHFGNSEMASK